VARAFIIALALFQWYTWIVFTLDKIAVRILIVPNLLFFIVFVMKKLLHKKCDMGQ
jgi:hypothetical protein